MECLNMETIAFSRGAELFEIYEKFWSSRGVLSTKICIASMHLRIQGGARVPQPPRARRLCFRVRYSYIY